MRTKNPVSALVALGLVLSLGGCPRREVTVQEDLIVAAADGDVAAMRRALAQGANIDGTVSPFNDPPLYMAVANDRREAVQALLDAGADPTRAGASGSILTAAKSEEVRRMLKGEARWSGRAGRP